MIAPPLSRRDFLRRGGAALAATSAASALFSAYGCSGSTVTPQPSALPWNALASKLSGRLVRPGDDGYPALARPNNLRYASTLPAGIALCANASDVSASILWAREHGVPLVARSGGHSYGGCSTTTGLMIDVRTMTSFAFDAATGIATFGGGARNRDVFAHCRNVNVAITHGRCLNVGVAGLTLGGGVGFSQRLHGLTCDQLVETEIVLADGSLHAVDGARDADLFWACRGGGGGNFGINTSFRFQTFPVTTLTAYDLWWDTDLERVFSALAQALEAAPDELGCKVSVELRGGAHGAPTMAIQLLGQLAGTPAQLHDILRPAYAIAPPSRVVFLEELPYWDAQDKLTELGPPEYYHESSRFFERSLTHADVATIFDGLRRWPGTVAAAAFKMFETGGRVNAVAPGATAFVHRASRWLSSLSLNWHGDTPAATLARNLDWQASVYDRIVALAKAGAYQNFIDPSLRDWQHAYYGANLPRLETVKRRVDPGRVFTFPEAIP